MPRKKQSDDGRYRRLDDILDLIRQLAASHEGVSLDDIQNDFNVKRSTAERMLRAVGRVLPELDHADDDGRVRRWRLPDVPNAFVQITAPELAEIEAAAKRLRGRGLDERAAHLDSAARKVRTVAKKLRTLPRIETDVEALLEAEGLAMRPGPRPKFADGLLSLLREALLANRRVKFRYRNPDHDKALWYTVEPHGILYGTRPNLVAPQRGKTQMKLWRLDRIEAPELLDEPFVRLGGFNLETFAQRSFGIFQEEPVNVVWKFNPDAAKDAKNWIFHPTQTIEECPDGSLVVRFRAGGKREMDWHLYTWGDAVNVVQPK